LQIDVSEIVKQMELTGKVARWQEIPNVKKWRSPIHEMEISNT
jgi:hypothetical protein